MHSNIADDPLEETIDHLTNGNVEQPEEANMKKPFLKLVDIGKLMDPKRSATTNSTVSDNDNSLLSDSVIIVSDSEQENSRKQKYNNTCKTNRESDTWTNRKNNKSTVLPAPVRCGQRKSNRNKFKGNLEDLCTTDSNDEAKTQSYAKKKLRKLENSNQRKYSISSDSDTDITKEISKGKQQLTKNDNKLHSQVYVRLYRIPCEGLLNQHIQKNLKEKERYVIF